MNCTACGSLLVHRDAINVNGNYNHFCTARMADYHNNPNPEPCPARKYAAYGCSAAVVPDKILVPEYHLPFLHEGNWFTVEGEINSTGLYYVHPIKDSYGSAAIGYASASQRQCIYWCNLKPLYCNEYFNDDARNLFHHLLKQPSAQEFFRRKRNYFME